MLLRPWITDRVGVTAEVRSGAAPTRWGMSVGGSGAAPSSLGMSLGGSGAAPSSWGMLVGDSGMCTSPWHMSTTGWSFCRGLRGGGSQV